MATARLVVACAAFGAGLAATFGLIGILEENCGKGASCEPLRTSLFRLLSLSLSLSLSFFLSVLSGCPCDYLSVSNTVFWIGYLI